MSWASPTEFSAAASSSRSRRGQPPGSGKRQRLEPKGDEYTTTAGGNFKPHVLTIDIGEDVAGKILSLAQMGSREICVISANGAVSNVTICQPGTSGGILTYEGQFEILTLLGPFCVNDDDATRKSALRVSLAGPDGRVIGGTAGSLIAAGPIQLVLGSFVPNAYKKHKKKHQGEDALVSPPLPANPDTQIAAIAMSQRDTDVIQPGVTPTPPALPKQIRVEPGPPTPAAPCTLTAATPTSQAPNIILLRGQTERNTAAGRDNQNGASHVAGCSGYKARPDHGQSPEINVPFLPDKELNNLLLLYKSL